MNFIILGAIMMATFTASLFFLRFWKTTKDRFFLFFSISFCIDGISRLLLGFANYADEYEPLIYSMRIVAFSVIAFAIIDKNFLQAEKNSDN